MTENLHAVGPLPDKEKNQLLITGTAVGSYGFEFKLPAPASKTPKEEDLFPVAAGTRETSTPEEAMENLEALFQSAAKGSDDDLAELVERIHPRAVSKAADFLK